MGPFEELLPSVKTPVSPSHIRLEVYITNGTVSTTTVSIMEFSQP